MNEEDCALCMFPDLRDDSNDYRLSIDSGRTGLPSAFNIRKK